ncbi:MAG: hypothetical protein ACRDUY_11025 [Nitriliruptorales bacterium]
MRELGDKSPSLELLASGDTTRIRMRVREWARLTRSVQAELPSEIRPHTDALASAAYEFAGLLEKYDYDLGALAEDPASRRLDAPKREKKLAEAQRRVAAYHDEHCSVARTDGAG